MAAATAAELRKEWGLKLRRRREERQLTQADLAKLTGLDQASISRVESGVGGLDGMYRIAKALGIALELVS